MYRLLFLLSLGCFALAFTYLTISLSCKANVVPSVGDHFECIEINFIAQSWQHVSPTCIALQNQSSIDAACKRFLFFWSNILRRKRMPEPSHHSAKSSSQRLRSSILSHNKILLSVVRLLYCFIMWTKRYYLLSTLYYTVLGSFCQKTYVETNKKSQYIQLYILAFFI